MIIMLSTAALHTLYQNVAPAHLPMLTSCLAVWHGAQGDPVPDVMLDS